jgi:6-phosphogluconolactonase
MKDTVLIECEDYLRLKIETVSRFCSEARDTISRRGVAVVGIPGGNSVRHFFEGLKETDHLTDDEWRRVHIFWADERLVPHASSDSNYRMAKELFLDDMVKAAKIDRSNIHPFPTSMEDVEGTLKTYEEDLRSLGGFDILVLGVGEDCHVASIFPKHPILDSKRTGYFVIKDAPKPPSERISITPREIESAPVVFLFFIGESKAKAYENFMDKKTGYFTCPAKLVENNINSKAYVIYGVI